MTVGHSVQQLASWPYFSVQIGSLVPVSWFVETSQFFSGGASGKKNPPSNARSISDMGSIPGSGRSPGGRNGIPLQYSCLWNSLDRRAWWAAVHGVAKSQTQLKWLSMHARSGLTHFWVYFFRFSSPWSCKISTINFSLLKLVSTTLGNLRSLTNTVVNHGL